MVTNVTLPPRSSRPSAKQQAQLDEKTTVFPLSSPPTDETAYLKSNGPENIFQKNNPFLSPNLSEASTHESESGASSEQDEFHLERYSSTMKRKHQGQVARKQSKMRTRPDLNVVTHFPSSQAKALAPGVKVNEVKAKKTAAKSRPKSVISAKAEHVYESGFARRANALANVKALAARRTNKKAINKPTPRADVLSKEQPAGESPIKPILIGISIPKHEADAHGRRLGHESAISLITPGTPQIVVTPAEEDGPWHHQQQPRLNPAPSVYSQSIQAPGAHLFKSVAPPMPEVPTQYDNASSRQVDQQQKVPKGILVRRDSFETVAYESPEHTPYPSEDRMPRQSSESQLRILPDNLDTIRPKSQGWWNLALSPMLSRAGTIRSVFNRPSPEDAKVPPLPTGPGRRLSRSTTFDSEASPETPRRIGMASARASTWSRWASWEKTRNENDIVERTRGMTGDGQPNTQDAPVFGATANTATISGLGLAAEYFHACAIEQLSGERYFACENHSCVEKLPKLQSVFDRRMIPDEDAAPSRAAAIIPVPMPQPEVGRQRTLSNSTQALSEPEELSPNVREANIATIGKAKAVESPPLGADPSEKKADPATLRALEGTDDAGPEPPSRPVPSLPRAQSARYPNIAAIVPPPLPVKYAGATVTSPGPISPESQRTIAPQGALPMGEMQQQPQQINYYNQFHYPQREIQAAGPTHFNVYNEPQKKIPQVQQKVLASEEASEKAKEEKEKKPGIFARLKQCAKARKVKNALTEPKPKKRKRVIAIFIVLLLMIIGAILLATQLTRHGDGTPTQQQWLNLTGYPPIPTGISTIIRPDITKTQAGCVAPNMWSCALPKENQAEVTPNDPDQPNFRFEITFENGTVPSNMTLPLTKRIDNPFSNNLFTPNPSPPSRADQIFMGNTTDNITEPFEGEATPFFMTFIPAFPINPNDPAVTGNITSRLARRQQTQNITDAIPAPDVQSDGSAAPANLLPTQPFPFSQPIQLYNRGQQTEHYGFYMYYDKAIFLSANAADSNDTSEPTSQENTQDSNGGSLRSQARARCTFSQTRFLVQIFTNPSFDGRLTGPINQTVNSAIDYTPPGSFPYPTTITTDRHGGNINKKAAYCYGVDNLQVIQDDVKAVVAEVRNVGGTLINPAPSLFEVEGDDSGFDQEAGGIDGGTGGCECVWQNWE